VRGGAVGVIGGSGLYELEGLTNVRWRRVRTPFGDPSDEFCTGELEGRPVVFLPRHGRGHRLTPTELNFRANVWGLKSLGVERIVSVSAVGSMKEDIRPLDLVIPGQFVDLTKRRVSSFFGEGIVAHVGMADPVCGQLSDVLDKAARATGSRVHRGGTYVCIEGPQFSTRAESRVYRSWGVDVIGMTNMPEAKLAREAELCYATLALATDYDVWHETHAGERRGGRRELAQERRDREGRAPSRHPLDRRRAHVRVLAPARERRDHESRRLSARHPAAPRPADREVFPARQEEVAAWLTPAPTTST